MFRKRPTHDEWIREVIRVRDSDSGTSAPLPNIPFEVLTEWSGGFRQRLGSGGFGEVFKGAFESSDGFSKSEIAIKKAGTQVTAGMTTKVTASKSPKGGSVTMATTKEDLTNQLQREIAVLKAFRHVNIIRLLGYSDDTELCLVYELADRGGLDSFYDADDRAQLLDWKRRIRVAVGCASALNYLHNCDKTTKGGVSALHRDVKSANFALSGIDFCPKLIDCGLSKYIPGSSFAAPSSVFGLFGGGGGGGRAGNKDSLDAQSRFGTRGFMCESYIESGIYDAKSEIYSFGILLAELMSGKKQVDTATSTAAKTRGKTRTQTTSVIGGATEKYLHSREACDDDVGFQADPRAGAWPAECVEDFKVIIGRCLDPKEVRIHEMREVLKRLKELALKYIRNDTTANYEGSYAEHIHALQAQVASAQAKVTRFENQERLGEVEAQLAEAEKARLAVVKAAEKAAEIKARERECYICMGPADVEQGIECSNKHFICDDCFPAVVSDQLGEYQIEAFKNNECQIVCAHDQGCRHVFPEHDILVHAGVAHITLRLQRIADVNREMLEKEKQAEVRRLVQEEVERLKKVMQGEFDEAADRRKRVEDHFGHIEKFFMLRCPKCHKEISLDFEACFAATCACNAKFCAWCQRLPPDGVNIHDFVKNCEFNPHKGDYGGGKERIAENVKNTNKRLLPERKRKLVEYFNATVHESDARDTFVRIEPLLKNVEMVLSNQEKNALGYKGTLVHNMPPPPDLQATRFQTPAVVPPPPPPPAPAAGTDGCCVIA